MSEQPEDKKKLEDLKKHILQAERMAAIGQMAAGMAHELNNPLTGILGHCQLLMQRSDLPGDIQADLARMEMEIKRCRRVITNFVRFSQRKDGETQSVDVPGLLTEALDIVEYDLSALSIRIDRKISDAVPPVRAEASRLQQVFLNVVSSARSAFDGKPGVIVVTVSHEQGWLMVTFAHDGHSVPANELAKIFEPPVANWPPVLGLAAAKTIVEEFGGRMRAENREGKGLIFTVELPSSLGSGS